MSRLGVPRPRFYDVIEFFRRHLVEIRVVLIFVCEKTRIVIFVPRPWESYCGLLTTYCGVDGIPVNRSFHRRRLISATVGINVIFVGGMLIWINVQI